MPNLRLSPAVSSGMTQNERANGRDQRRGGGARSKLPTRVMVVSSAKRPTRDVSRVRWNDLLGGLSEVYHILIYGLIP